jgi:heme iron utilization protein
MSPTRARHAEPTPATGQASTSEPTLAERARTLLELGRTGSLSTHSRKQPGFPFGSLLPYAMDTGGHPIFLISTMAMHTKNLQADSRASLLVTQPGVSGDPLAASRVTLVGNAKPVAEAELATARAIYLKRHPNSNQWVEFEDFSFYFLDVVDVYYIGGFGVMGWVPSTDYDRAQADPLLDSAPEIIAHMNKDHADALVLLTRAATGINPQKARMTSVDRLGFQVHLQTEAGSKVERLSFPRAVGSPVEARTALIEMVALARQK